MDTADIILLITGAIAVTFGIGAFFYPNLARWIRAPGGPRLKASIATIVGIILIIISFIIEIPME